MGSSPHGRGTRRQHCHLACGHGIIPACAGNTDCPKRREACSRDHPRMCGEHTCCVTSKSWAMGSSPHVRGTQPRDSTCRVSAGIIPACAGNTKCEPCGCSASGDHPRMCGEHPTHRVITKGYEGSSPHVRGTPACRSGVQLQRGIIPACAGNTSVTRKGVYGLWDHPRMCGEHGLRRWSWLRGWGSSPHVRGTPRQFQHNARHSGIIPACAGNTRFAGGGGR